jgi:hypothetical protein
MIPTRFRSDYSGEFIILESKWSAGRKQQTREWIPNPIENHHLSGRAVCIGSGVDTWQFDYTRLQRHRGGLLGSKKLQTYGTGTITQTMRLDFAVVPNAEELQQLIDADYQESNIVYTTSRNCILNPGQFYLIPYSPRLIDLALLPYLAAFDGHQEVFLIGYTKEMPATTSAWQSDIASVFSAYPGVKFHLVGLKTNMPESWLEHANVEHFDYRQFISYCDV